MAQLERDIAKAYLKTLTSDQRRAKISAGQGWIAAKKDTFRPPKPMTVKVYPGDLVLRHAQPFFGAPAGTADYIGFDSVIVTQDMVGQRVAIFAADEIKSPNDRLRPLQRLFQRVVLALGGRYKIIRRETLLSAETAKTQSDSDSIRACSRADAESHR